MLKLKQILEKAKEIKRTRFENPLSKTIFAGWLISKRFSYYISAIYILKNKTPNYVTSHMIYSGIIGALLFMQDNIYIKIIGVLFIQLWFILDYSDGEVARETKIFSKYGREFDYLAHIINHPLFSLALLFSLLQLKRYNVTILIVLFLLSTILDLVNRNIFAFRTIIDLKTEVKKEESLENMKLLTKVRRTLQGIITTYPNIPLLGVFCYFIDVYYGTSILYIYIILNVVFTFLILLKSLVVTFKTFNNS